ncbi:tyrosine-type recombinase/integrase [Gluconobacter roseus]|uniref:tyrosine-type recombinase/integrase n=1 Tax=Gluconobacter roseus TaxID=586239 RepID=UPI0038CF69D0
MPRIASNRLTARTVASLKDGVYGDGSNLWLTIKGNVRAWSVRFKSPITGKSREMGLGPVRDVGLAEARRLATEARHMIADGLDPIEERKAEKAARKRKSGLTFEDVARRYIQEQTPAWKDQRSAPVWTSSLEIHVFPTFGKKLVSAVDTDDVLKILRPIWTEKTETAGRVRGRIERILDYAKTHGWRESENPARWRGHLSNILPAPSKVAKVEHHAAVNRKDIARVMAALAASNGLAAQAVRFLCLTAARSGEVRFATWDEVDLEQKIWTVPAERMKAKREHRVPLSDSALEILQSVLPLRNSRQGDFIFPGQRRGKPLTDVALSKALHTAAGTKEVTVHGLRSTFRDWAAEETDFPREVAEMALAHAIGDKVEAAYRRGDLFNKRQQLSEDWENFIIPNYEAHVD